MKIRIFVKPEFTVEEENLICTFDVSSRLTIINGIITAIDDFEPELQKIAYRVIKKLGAINDEIFSELVFSPAYDGGYQSAVDSIS